MLKIKKKAFKQLHLNQMQVKFFALRKIPPAVRLRDGGGGFKKPTRREAAQKILNSSSHLTPQILFDTINAEYVLADTIFQAIINVQLGIWNISQPDLKDGVVTIA